MSHWLRRVKTFLPWLELLALVVAAPLLAFPTVRPRWSALALLALIVLYLLRWIMRREPWPVTPFNGTLLLFMLVIPVTVWASAWPDLTLPKLTGLILGLATFRMLAFSVQSRRSLLWAIAAFAVVGLGIWAVGVLGAGWVAKFAWLAPITRRLPRALIGLPGAPDSGINLNQLAGALLLYLPVAVAGVVGWGRRRRLGPTLLSLMGLGLTGGTLILTQSRSGWLGGLAGLAALVILAGLISRDRRVRLVAVGLPLLAGIAGVFLVLWQPQIVAQFIDLPGTAGAAIGGEIPLSGRPEIWSRTLYAIQDFPFTGTGLGAFRRVVNLFYPLFTVGPDSDIGHAHNIFLQVAVDVGLPGLIAYLACLWVAVVTAWSAARHSSGLSKALSLGLLAGLVGLHVYGTADTIALGAKPGIVFWMALGLIAALPRATGMVPTTTPTQPAATSAPSGAPR